MDRPLKRIDHLMWDAEVPNSLVTIAGVMFFKNKLSRKKLTEVVRARLLRYERFRKKVVTRNGVPMWHSDEGFEPETHIHHIALPGNGTYKDLQDCVSDLISQPLNYSKPLWDAHIIDNYRGGSVLLWRLHHAVADGMSLISVVFSLTGKTAKESLNIPLPPVKPEKKSKNKAGFLPRLGIHLYQDAMHFINNPDALADTLQRHWASLKEVKQLLAGKPMANNIYKGKLGLIKKAAWTVALPLDAIKKISRANEVTVNDILVAAVAGAVRKHLLRHRIKITEGMKIVVPINIRKQTDDEALHNEFSFISFNLPVHLKTTRQRIAYVHHKTAMLKPSTEPLLLEELTHMIADYSPDIVKNKIFELMGEHIAGVVTNVPGPPHPIYLAGQKVEDLSFWVPHTAPLGVGISLMSYNKKVYMGIVTDIGLVKDPDYVTKAFADEIKLMEKSLTGKKKQS